MKTEEIIKIGQAVIDRMNFENVRHLGTKTVSDLFQEDVGIPTIEAIGQFHTDLLTKYQNATFGRRKEEQEKRLIAQIEILEIIRQHKLDVIEQRKQDKLKWEDAKKKYDLLLNLRNQDEIDKIKALPEEERNKLIEQFQQQLS